MGVGAMQTQSIEEALAELRRGRQILLVDPVRNEAELCMAATAVTPDDINFMVTHGRGLVCVAIPEGRIRRLAIPMLAPEGRGSGRAYAASIEASRGVTTGISAADRAVTIQAVMAADAGPDDVVMPGHVFPIRVRDSGVLGRPDMPEAAVDLTRLAGLEPGAVLCTVLDEEGEVASAAELERLAERFGLRTVAIGEVLEHRLRSESLVRRVADAPVTTSFGATFRCVVYESDVDRKQHVALVRGEISTRAPMLVRIHSQCLTGDVFGSERCDCGDQLQTALETIDRAGSGILLYMHQEGRGIGLANKIRAYALQDQGLDTVQANLELGFADDGRDYGIAAQMLRDLGVSQVRLLTNNPKKIQGLTRYGVVVESRQPIEIPAHQGTLRYLQTKREKLGHLFTELDASGE